jgi:hypothetical protein
VEPDIHDQDVNNGGDASSAVADNLKRTHTRRTFGAQSPTRSRKPMINSPVIGFLLGV